MSTHPSLPAVSSTRLGITSLGCAALLVLASPAAAQDTTVTPGVPQFEPGQWAAEFGIGNGIGGIGAMRFRSATSAWLLDGNLGLSAGESEGGVGETNDADHYSVDLRAGLRRYLPLRRSAAAFHTLGIMAGVSRSSQEASAPPGVPDPGTLVSRSWRTGLFAELGASYFVTPSLSLGARTLVSGGYSRVSAGRPDGLRNESKNYFLTAGGIRLLGTLYF
ncbi:MAG TPA: hypothetical protein VGE02_16130 [Gemmatimonadales bacterium]